MAAEYVSKAGDALDLICYREYGADPGAVEQVLEANPHIKDQAHRLPAGVKISLPDLAPRPQAQQPLRLWD